MTQIKDFTNQGIKEIIDAHPVVAKILDEYGIGCGACDVGTCLFKDIVSLHPISEVQQNELIKRISDVINSQ